MKILATVIAGISSMFGAETPEPKAKRRKPVILTQAQEYEVKTLYKTIMQNGGHSVRYPMQIKTAVDFHAYLQETYGTTPSYPKIAALVKEAKKEMEVEAQEPVLPGMEEYRHDA